MSHRADAPETIPAVFAGAREYRDDPAALELAQATFNEEALYVALVAFALEWHRRTGRRARVLDLCAATGLCALRIAQAIPFYSVTLVDIDATALHAGAVRFDGLCPVSLSQADAVEFEDGCRYDLILMNSAYHHIEDERKVALLSNARRLLTADGGVLVGEHFLPPYRNSIEYRTSVIAFYSSLLAELKRRGEPAEAIGVVRRSGLYGWQGEYEYKVCWDVFDAHLKAARLKGHSESWVWRPVEHTEGRIGSAAVAVSRRL